jgi:hypothetical protein
MDRRTMLVAAASASAWFRSAKAAESPLDVSGVRFPNTMNVNGTSLVLNGAGVRHKRIFEVYALGLYLPKKTTSADEAMSMTGPKRIVLVPLRSISMTEFGRMFTQAIQTNTSREDFVKILPEVSRVGQIFSHYARLSSGESLMIDWLPDVGMVGSYKGVVQGEPFTEPSLFRTVMRIWLGTSPPDAKLKSSLLGQDLSRKVISDGSMPAELL